MLVTLAEQRDIPAASITFSSLFRELSQQIERGLRQLSPQIGAVNDIGGGS